MKHNLPSLWKTHKSDITAIAGTIAVLAVMFALKIPCPIRYITGVSCPGCGMSRACFAALQLDFDTAFSYHPLWIALPFATISLLFCKVRNHQTTYTVILGICIVALIAVWLYRLLCPDTAVVVFHPENGAVFRAIQTLQALFYHG